MICVTIQQQSHNYDDGCGGGGGRRGAQSAKERKDTPRSRLYVYSIIFIGSSKRIRQAHTERQEKHSKSLHVQHILGSDNIILNLKG